MVIHETSLNFLNLAHAEMPYALDFVDTFDLFLSLLCRYHLVTTFLNGCTGLIFVVFLSCRCYVLYVLFEPLLRLNYVSDSRINVMFPAAFKSIASE